jgi:hypothetical protein
MIVRIIVRMNIGQKQGGSEPQGSEGTSSYIVTQGCSTLAEAHAPEISIFSTAIDMKADGGRLSTTLKNPCRLPLNAAVICSASQTDKIVDICVDKGSSGLTCVNVRIPFGGSRVSLQRRRTKQDRHA